MGALVKIEKNKKALSATLTANEKLIMDRLPGEQEQQDFRENFLELAESDYLIEKVDPKHILTFALNVSKLGININPIYKEAYIVPFQVKNKGMMPTLIMPKQGIRQIAYDAGFFLDIDRVYNLNGEIIPQSKMNREQLASLKTTDGKWVDEHFEGFEISLTDLMDGNKKLPVQSTFVGAEYVKKVTKQLQSQDYKIQSWEHKACRRAFNEFFIPRGRKNVVLDEVEKLNDLQEFDEADKLPSDDKDLKKSILEDDAIDADYTEMADEETFATVKDVLTFYKKHKGTDKGNKIEEAMMDDAEWRSHTPEKLTELYNKLKSL